MSLLGRGGSPNDEITYNKGKLAYPSSVIEAKPLLVAGRSHHGGVLHLLEHVDIRLMLFHGLLLIVEVDARSVEVEVGGVDRLSPLDEEEGVVPH